MENIAIIDSTATVVRQITAEVKQGKPITITSNDVDVSLMNKLFGEKRGYIAATRSTEEASEPIKSSVTCIPISKRKKIDPEPTQVDKNLMSVLFKEEKKSEAEDLPTSCSSPSPPLIIPHAQRQGKRFQKENWIREDLIKLQKEALEAQIMKDRAKTLYYSKKLELLEKDK